jgi:hypothetical protein
MGAETRTRFFNGCVGGAFQGNEIFSLRRVQLPSPSTALIFTAPVILSLNGISKMNEG